jgi:glycosyltransferase involved in cell wall biosynthesis
MRLNKGVRFILNSVGSLPCPVHWVGGTAAERAESGDVDNIVLSPPIEHSQVEARLSNASVLLLPLGDNSFSRRHTSPLKLWDYLATNRPIVAADTPAVTEIAAITDTRFFLYTPEDQQSLNNAVEAALSAPPRLPFRRTWHERAMELSSIAETLS